MDRDELAFAGVVRQAELVRGGVVSSRELVELYLERIARLDPELNAFRMVMAERAVADAQQADARRAGGDERPLLGVPIAVKDCEDVAGEVTGWGTAANSTPARADNELVRRLREAGAVILGKTNLPELAIIGDTEGPAFGVTRNPWDTGRSPAGSSGGSAAAVAAGLCAAATGSDGAGSIRLPAGNCGLVGLKPSRDRIPLSPLTEHWYGLSVVGFLTRTVADTALLMTVGARDPSLAEAAGAAPRRLRVASSVKPFFPARVDPVMRRLVDEMGSRLRGLGHEVETADPPYPLVNPLTSRFLGGIAQDAGRVERPERLQRRARGFARLGRAIAPPVLDWARREDTVERMRPLFERHDVLLTPLCARPPVRAAQWEGRGALYTLLAMASVYPFTGHWNLTGQPAIAVPAGSAEDGMPVGLQLVGRPGEEATLIALAAQLEADLDWPARRPPPA
ncbi:MAG TPA: amidase [Thermoleophilaceae bacterium]|jgi:amidase|nr:amidase [Thermoleophilaceae bacterium]